jgi:hypothetical protein
MRRIQMQVRSELWRGFAAAHLQRMKERLAERLTNVACTDTRPTDTAAGATRGRSTERGPLFGQ